MHAYVTKLKLVSRAKNACCRCELNVHFYFYSLWLFAFNPFATILEPKISLICNIKFLILWLDWLLDDLESRTLVIG